MFKKGSKLNSIFKGSCPRCQNESMYKSKNLYNFNETFKMNDNCSSCGLKYQVEPSFFYGAMYVSYALGVAFAVAAFVISKVFIGTSLKISFIAIAATIVVFMPVIMRLSRNIWINIFVKYNPNKKS